MKINCRCENCGNMYAIDISNQDDDRVCLEIDFKEKIIRCICPNVECGHENELNFKTWQNQQRHSPLPRIGLA